MRNYKYRLDGPEDRELRNNDKKEQKYDYVGNRAKTEMVNEMRQSPFFTVRRLRRKRLDLAHG